MEIVVSLSATSQSALNLSIANIGWKGLRCTIATEGNHSGLSTDIRTRPGDPSSSIAGNTKPLGDNGTASLLIEDEDLEGTGAFVVILADGGTLVAQSETTIGGANR